jgi:RNA polymerase sigma-70 factor, ECF subfamily
MPRVDSGVQIALARNESGLDHSNMTDRVPNFAILHRTYFDFVWSIARYLGVDPAEMDDVVQDVFVTVYHRVSTLQRPESLRSWIYSVTRRVVSAHHRTKRTALITTGTDPVESEMLQPEWSTPQRLAEQSEQANLLSNLLKELDAPKHEMIVLADLEEMTAPEIAAAIGIPLNTVYTRLRAARIELEEALQRYRARTEQRGRDRSS